MSGGALKMRKRGKNGPLFKTFVPLGSSTSGAEGGVLWQTAETLLVGLVRYGLGT